MKIVIVGGVAGGASAAARARRLDESAEITVLERGPYVSFANCGLPYHIGGAIKKRDHLLISSPQVFRENFEIDVRTGHEAIGIDRRRKAVRVREVASGREYEEPYDNLILSQGAAPVHLPAPGAGLPRVFSLRDIPDMDGIMAALDSGVSEAVVVGAGYIGIEAAEALRERGLRVHLVELQEQILPLFDTEIISDLHMHLLEKGVHLHLGASVEELQETEDGLAAQLSNGETVTGGVCIVAVGVRPETGLARAAGLEIGDSGGVRVDQHMRTSDPDIYAVGDMVEVTDTVTGAPAAIPLAGPANRQGRIAADHVCGRDSCYTTTQGTAIVKIFEMTAALTGGTEQSLWRAGIPCEKIYLWPFGHATYYPGAASMHIKLLFSPSDGKVLGAQVIGREGVDKRIDIFAVAVRTGLTVFDLESLELAYAPPYGSAKDPVNMAGFVGANVLNGDVRFWFADEHPSRTAAGTILDVRTKREYSQGHIEGAVNIPIHEVRSRLAEIGELPQPFFIYCLTGIRSYIVYRILLQHGFPEVYNLAGGWKSFESCHRELAPGVAPSVRFTEK